MMVARADGVKSYCRNASRSATVCSKAAAGTSPQCPLEPSEDVREGHSAPLSARHKLARAAVMGISGRVDTENTLRAPYKREAVLGTRGATPSSRSVRGSGRAAGAGSVSGGGRLTGSRVRARFAINSIRTHDNGTYVAFPGYFRSYCA